MTDNYQSSPWVSFCISTYKRPSFLKKQLASLLEQTDKRFEIVISDNDPEGSAGPIARSFGDARIKYFQNEGNLGMIKSFNRSIDRASTDYVTMVTDDDPIDISFLQVVGKLRDQYPGHSLYGGFLRAGKKLGNIEKIGKNFFVREILDPSKTPSILWSSCILKRADAIQIGKIPDYGSPHLADHALIVMTGSISGGVIINNMYSDLTQHEDNFSKLNFEMYVNGCDGFYKSLTKFFGQAGFKEDKLALERHLNKWFITCIFNLKRYYTIRKNKAILLQVDSCAKRILSFPFMKGIRARYYAKLLILNIKKNIGWLNP